MWLFSAYVCDTLDNERLDEDDDDDDNNVPYKTFDDWLIKSFTCKDTQALPESPTPIITHHHGLLASAVCM